MPKKFGRRLFDGYAGPKRLWEISEAGRNSLPARSREQWSEVIAFWRTNTPGARPPN